MPSSIELRLYITLCSTNILDITKIMFHAHTFPYKIILPNCYYVGNVCPFNIKQVSSVKSIYFSKVAIWNPISKKTWNFFGNTYNFKKLINWHIYSLGYLISFWDLLLKKWLHWVFLENSYTFFTHQERHQGHVVFLLCNFYWCFERHNVTWHLNCLGFVNVLVYNTCACICTNLITIEKQITFCKEIKKSSFVL